MTSHPDRRAEIAELRQALAAVGAAPGGRSVAVEALQARVAVLSGDVEVLAEQLCPLLERLRRLFDRLDGLEGRHGALVALAVATGRHDQATDPTADALVALQAATGWDGLAEVVAAAGVHPTA